jgi:hypothetical protein
MNMRTCDSCGVARECDSVNENLISEGIVLPFRELGYYGGFVDDVPWVEWDDETELFNICGKCVLVMLRALPGLGMRLAARYPDEVNLKQLFSM